MATLVETSGVALQADGQPFMHSALIHKMALKLKPLIACKTYLHKAVGDVMLTLSIFNPVSHVATCQQKEKELNACQAR